LYEGPSFWVYKGYGESIPAWMVIELAKVCGEGRRSEGAKGPERESKDSFLCFSFST